MKMKILHIVLFFILSLLITAVSGQNLHVAVTGSDATGNGTIGNPYATITKASQKINPGDTVFVHAGTYHNANFGDGDIWKIESAVKILANGTAGNYIVFMPYPGDVVTIEFDATYGVQIKNASYVKFTGFNIKGIADNITKAEALDKWGWYKDSGGTLHDLAVEMGIKSDMTEANYMNLWGQQLNKPATNNIKRPDYYNGVGILDITSHHIIMENNTVSWCTSSGMRIQRSDNTTARNNKIFYNTYRTCVGSGALTMAESDYGGDYNGNTVVKNEIHHNENQIYSWAPSKSFVHFVIDEGSGIFFTRNNENNATLGHSYVANNLSYKNGASGIVIHKTNGVIVEHNTFFDNGTTNGDAKPGGMGYNSADDVMFRNNISWSKETKFALGQVGGGNTNITFSGNIVFNNNGSQSVVKIVDPVTLINGGYTEVNPQFVDETTFDFHIQATSPAVDAGDNNALVTDDFEGFPRTDGNLDIGAYECHPVLRWNGSVNKDWLTANNWSPAKVPASNDDVLIPAGLTNYPFINDGSTTALCKNAEIENGAKIVISRRGSLTVSGKITNNAGLSGLKILSSAVGTGSLIHNTPDNISVDAKIECYLASTSQSWHMLTSPVADAPLSVFPENELYFYDESTADYWSGNDYLGSTSGWTTQSGNLQTAKGYLYKSTEDTLLYKGQLNALSSGTGTTINYTNNGVDAPNGNSWDDFDGWNLIGNPFTATIDWENAGVDKSNANINDAIYYYDGINNNYVSYVSGAGTNCGTQYIPAMQGFFVKADNSEQGGTLNINASALVHNDQAFWKNSTQTPENFLRLEISENGYTDETVVRFNSDATNDMDKHFDAYKIFSYEEEVPQICTKIQNASKLYSINTLQELNEDEEIYLPLKIHSNTGICNINVTEFNFPETKVYLQDNVNGNVTELNNGTVFSFSDITDTENRFEIIFSKKTLTSLSQLNDYVNIFPNPNNGTFKIVTGNNNEINSVEIKNIIGQTIYKTNSINETFTITSSSNQLYFVKIKFKDKTVTYKKIIIKH